MNYYLICNSDRIYRESTGNLISWAPDFGSIEIKITFHEGKIAKTEERRTITVLRSSES